MINNRLFDLLIAVALIITLAFTVREVFATSSMTSQVDARVTCADLPSRYSIHSKYIQKAHMWIPYTGDGPAGLDGGLKELMFMYRTCTR